MNLADFGIAQVDPAITGFKRSIPQIVVQDDFYSDPDAIRQLALDQEFAEHPQYHKGLRTEKRFLFPNVKERFQELLGGAEITTWIQDRQNGVFQYCTENDKVVYHSDAQAYAAVVYLTPDAPLNAGTSLYRSKVTGLRRPPTQEDANRIGATVTELEEQTYRDKLLDPKFWELVDTVGNVYNRLVIWDAKLIHAATSYFGQNANNGRLFQLFFFDVKKG